MIIKYDARFNNKAILENITRVINQVYRLLPVREEHGDWQKPLENLVVEVAGMASLITGHQTELFNVLCKLEGMKTLVSEDDFLVYRRTIFECLSLLGEMKSHVQP